MEVISREEARAAGLSRFYTGVPCLHGHDAERYVSSKGCIVCNLSRVTVEKTQKWRKENPELRAAQRKRYKKKYPHKVAVQKMRRDAAQRGAKMPDHSPEDTKKEQQVILSAQLMTDAGREYHCDHIVALSGVTEAGDPIFGPHVWWNLRPLDGKENIEKSNLVTEAHIELALSKLRNSGVSAAYLEEVEANLRAGRKPCEWILPVKGQGTQ